MKRDTILVINGPNLNMLGVREPHHYGHETWEVIEARLHSLANGMNIGLSVFQSNHIGYIVDHIQQRGWDAAGIVINPAGYTGTGFPILDALMMTDKPFVEVHLSNIYAREGWHRDSIFSAKAVGCVSGFRGFVYDLGLKAIHHYLNHKT